MKVKERNTVRIVLTFLMRHAQIQEKEATPRINSTNQPKEFYI